MKLQKASFKTELSETGFSGKYLTVERNHVDMELVSAGWLEIRSRVHKEHEPVLVPIENVAAIVPMKGERKRTGFDMPNVIAYTDIPPSIAPSGMPPKAAKPAKVTEPKPTA